MKLKGLLVACGVLLFTSSILAQSGGGELSPIPKEIIGRVASQKDAVTAGQGAALTWPGLLRKLDRIDSSYRE